MCNPAFAFAALAAGTTAVTVVEQAQAARAQKKAIEAQYAAQTDQIREQESSDINERLRAARREQGRVRVAAGEAGLQLAGSVAGLLQDSVMQTALYDERVRANAGHRIESATAEANSAFSRIQQPTILGAGLRIAAGAAGGYKTGKGLQLARSRVGSS